MNYLLEAMQSLGYYYTPLNVLYSAGKTRPVGCWSQVAGNPPFGMTPCPRCHGSGFIATKHGVARCPFCNVERKATSGTP